MAIKDIDHVGILVGDPAPAEEFYVGLLGFEVESDETIPPMGMRVVMLKKGRDRVELIQRLAPDPKASPGLKHLAFSSDDLEGDLRSLAQRGAKLLHQEVRRHGPVSFFFLRSPSGELVELIQRPEEPS
ncbi:MAG: VOC family protein [Elusimicrobia bacterium]|nr:VOC family protein [Elusimicrobiota bacterium]